VRVLRGLAVTCFALVLAVGAFAGISVYRIDHAVHHVTVPASLLAQGQDDLLTLVTGPHHSEEAYLFHTAGGKTHVLLVPISLGIKTAHGTVPLSSLDIHAPDAIISGLRQVGIPVAHYIGVDLHAVPADSKLGRLATGKLSVTSLISDPTGTASLLEQVASHVYLGPNTPVSALLELMHVPTTNPVSVPTATDAQGRVVLAAPYVSVLRKFL
jgi:hypothetical protein